MANYSGSCLCGEIRYEINGEPMRAANCHCDDCRKATGASYATNFFFKENDIVVTQGSPKEFSHKSDKGNTMIKQFCGNCGSQLFGKNSNRPNMVSLRAGVQDQTDLIKPTVNVYLSSRIASTPVDPDLKGFEKMPG